MPSIASGGSRPADHVHTRVHSPKHASSFQSTLDNATADAATPKGSSSSDADAAPSLIFDLGAGSIDANSVANVVSRVVQHPRMHGQKQKQKQEQDSSGDFSSNAQPQVPTRTHCSPAAAPQADDKSADAPQKKDDAAKDQVPIYVASTERDPVVALKIPAVRTEAADSDQADESGEAPPPSYAAPAQPLTPVSPKPLDLQAAGPKQLVFQLTLRVPTPKPEPSNDTPDTKASQDASDPDAGATLLQGLTGNTDSSSAGNAVDPQLGRPLPAPVKFVNADNEAPADFGRQQSSDSPSQEKQQSERSQSVSERFETQALPEPLTASSASTFVVAAPLETAGAHATKMEGEPAAPAARPSATPAIVPPKPAFQPLQSIGVLVRAADQVIRLQVRQTMGTVRVDVHSDDAALNEQLRDTLPQLVRRLDEQGLQPRVTLAPGPAAVVLHHNTAQTDMQDRNGAFGKDDAARQQQQQQQRQRQNQRAWQGLASELQED